MFTKSEIAEMLVRFAMLAFLVWLCGDDQDSRRALKRLMRSRVRYHH